MTRRDIGGLVLGVAAAHARPQGNAGKPVRIVIAGLVHGHVSGFFRRFAGRSEFELVGVAESRTEVADRLIAEFNLNRKQFFTTLDTALDTTKPEAVMAFTDTFDHAAVIQSCARRGVHVMVEKPLAVNLEHARRIEAAAKQGNIHVLVNYETTWYPTTQQLPLRVLEQKAIGPIRKIVVRDGHQGPKEIGVPPEFLEWLIDPVRNGAGALFDFGCYGANLVTWLMNGQRPATVTASVQTMKPATYAKVDDDATIVLTYPAAQAVIQPSWNWPFSRKDIEIYGETGYLLAPDRDTLRLRTQGKREDEVIKAAPNTNEYKDELAYFTAVVRGGVKPSGLSALPNNLIVTEILDAARRSAQTGRTIRLT